MRISDWSSDVCSSDLRATAQADPRIVADAALKQVIWNVLDNARDASNKAILLLVERTGDTLGVEVRDEGPGFAPDTLAQLGRPYHSTQGRPGGGLGLFLVTNVIDRKSTRLNSSH